MNIYDISQQSGVSIATVSRVINGSANVSERTRQKVLNVMQECEYTPNAFARGLTAHTMHTVGILCPDSSDAHLARAIFYLEQNLRSNHYNVLLCCTGYSLEGKQNDMQLLLAKSVDAVILVSSTFVSASPEENEYIRQASERVPVIILNAALDAPNIYSVFCNDEKAIENATLRLIRNGRKRILFLYNSLSYSCNRKRTGYEKALEASGLPLDPALLQFCKPESDSITGVREFMRELSDKGLTYDAVIASDDNLAVGVIKYAKKAGVAIPSALSVIGYNNSALAECCEPELTSIDCKLSTLCSQCSDALLAVLSGKEFPNRSVFATELIERTTTDFND